MSQNAVNAVGGGTVLDLDYDGGSVNVVTALDILDVLIVVARSTGRVATDNPLIRLEDTVTSTVFSMAVENFVRAGGRLVMFDGFKGGINSVLPGTDDPDNGFTLNEVRFEEFGVRWNEFTNPATNPIKSGIEGTTDNFFVSDNGGGHVGGNPIANLPTGSQVFITDRDSGQAIDFEYQLGQGAVYYSSTNAWRGLTTPALTNRDGLRISAGNTIAYNVSQAASVAPIPLPASWAALLLGLGALGGVRLLWSRRGAA